VTFIAMSLAPVSAKSHFDLRDFAAKPDAWFRSPEGLRVTTNILSWQSPEGSWPKNLDTSAKPHRGDPKQLKGTFDNGATTGEMRFLASAFRVTGNPQCEEACLKGLDLILKAQYPTGGWPQFYPPSHQYHRHITFNDDAMVRLLVFLREVARSPDFAFLAPARRKAAQESFDRGIQCILKCQVVASGKLTVWCAQHDEVNYQPRGGRKYELPSLSGSESADILEFLMSLDHPSAEVVRAINAGAQWFESAKLNGIRVVKLNGERKVVPDASAPPLWARFYDLEDGRPIFSDRDGIKKYDSMQIGRERRNGYAWYGNWGLQVERSYARWKTQHPTGGEGPKPSASAAPSPEAPNRVLN
jgi:PelA/Pel-15E family pectate lyase